MTTKMLEREQQSTFFLEEEDKCLASYYTNQSGW